MGDSSSDHLFVYGTLRRGARMHALLEGAARPVGPARYRGRIHQLGGYPGAVASEDPADVVHGELYAFPLEDSDSLLARLDHYEGSEFERTRAPVQRRDGGSVESWLYLYRGSLAGRPRIASGDSLDSDPAQTRSSAHRGAGLRRAAPAGPRG